MNSWCCWREYIVPEKVVGPGVGVIMHGMRDVFTYKDPVKIYPDATCNGPVMFERYLDETGRGRVVGGGVNLWRDHLGEHVRVTQLGMTVWCDVSNTNSAQSILKAPNGLFVFVVLCSTLETIPAMVNSLPKNDLKSSLNSAT